MKPPCYGCCERLFGCHSKCNKYNEWKSKHMELQEKIRDSRKRERDANSAYFKPREEKRLKWIKSFNK